VSRIISGFGKKRIFSDQRYRKGEEAVSEGYGIPGLEI
jgi:hypothetical protein